MSVFTNQVGYYTNSVKIATVKDVSACTLFRNDKIIKEFNGFELKYDENSGDNISVVDFSEIKEPGIYYFTDNLGNKSCSFTISDNPYDKLFTDIQKMFYFQRCGMELEEKYAGIYSHKACHTAKVTLLKDPSVSCDCLGGWHDAGDYGRYVSAGAVAVAHLLYAYDLCKDIFNVSLNIPESGNGMPDILSEVAYELKFLLCMQRNDGAMYHKCTSMYHTGFVMPEDDGLPFFITPVTSVSTGDACGVFAQAAAIYKKYDEEFSKTLKEAAIKSFEWLLANPLYIFENPKECYTGTYEDPCDSDERLYAYTQIYLLTGDERCLGLIRNILEYKINTTALGWSDVGGFTSLAVLTAGPEVFPDDLTARLRQQWLDEADRLVNVSTGNNYGIACHPYNFNWGSNMGVLLNGMVLCFAHHLTGLDKYITAAIAQFDYILGRNAMDVSYVTGHGERAFRNPHNRPTVADNIDDPIPGFVSGGPNRFPCDPDAKKIIPEGTAPMKCFADVIGSYSTNEITIYWNSPLVFLLAYIKSVFEK